MKIWPLIALAFVFAAVSSPAAACRCARADDAAHLAATPFVFTGRAAPVEPASDGRALLFRFEVTKTWKGSLPATIVVRTARSSASCGASFAPGRVYTVFASPFTADMLETGLCQLAPYRSRPEQLEMLMTAYQGQVQQFEQRVAAGTADELGQKLEFLRTHSDWSAAVATLDAMLKLPTADKATLLIERGMANYRLVRLDAARDDFSAALSLAPQSPLAARGIAALDRLASVPSATRPAVHGAWPELFEQTASP